MKASFTFTLISLQQIKSKIENSGLNDCISKCIAVVYGNVVVIEKSNIMQTSGRQIATQESNSLLLNVSFALAFMSSNRSEEANESPFEDWSSRFKSQAPLKQTLLIVIALSSHTILMFPTQRVLKLNSCSFQVCVYVFKGV